MTHCTMSKCSYHEATSRSPIDRVGATPTMRPKTQSRVSGWEGKKGAIEIFKQLRNMSERLNFFFQKVNLFAQAKH